MGALRRSCFHCLAATRIRWAGSRSRVQCSRMNFKRILVLIGVFWSGGVIVAQPLPVLYDSRIKPAKLGVGIEQKNHVIQDVLRVGAAALKRDCDSSQSIRKPVLKAVARGSFTRKAAQQVAYLLELCWMRRFPDNGFYGVALYESNRLVSVSGVQITSLYGAIIEAFGVRDINLNGLDELGFVWGWGDGCASGDSLVLLEMGRSGLKSRGELEVMFRDGCEEPEPSERRSWLVYVLRGSSPVFIGFEQIRKGPPTRLTLRPAPLEIQTWFVK
jgi:hypothetical protein